MWSLCEREIDEARYLLYLVPSWCRGPQTRLVLLCELWILEVFFISLEPDCGGLVS